MLKINRFHFLSTQRLILFVGTSEILVRDIYTGFDTSTSDRVTSVNIVLTTEHLILAPQQFCICTQRVFAHVFAFNGTRLL